MNTFLFLLPFLIICLPVFLSIVFFKKHMNKYHHKWKAIHFMVSMTTFFYLIAVILLVMKLFGINILGYIIIAMIIFIMVTLIIQYKKTEEVALIMALKLMWRTSFLFFLIIYVILIVYAIVKMIQFFLPLFL